MERERSRADLGIGVRLLTEGLLLWRRGVDRALQGTQRVVDAAARGGGRARGGATGLFSVASSGSIERGWVL